MKFSSSIFAAFVAVAPVSAGIMKRDFITLINDGAVIYSDLQYVYAQLTAFGPGNSTGTIGQALSVYNSTTGLTNDLNKAASDAAASGPLSDSDSTAIASAIAQLQTNIYNTLDLVVTKAPQFNQVQGFLPVGGLVDNQLMNLKNATDAYGAALIPKLTPEYQKLAPLLVSDFDFHFTRAIQVFNSSFF